MLRMLPALHSHTFTLEGEYTLMFYPFLRFFFFLNLYFNTCGDAMVRGKLKNQQRLS